MSKNVNSESNTEKLQAYVSRLEAARQAVNCRDFEPTVSALQALSIETEEFKYMFKGSKDVTGD